LQGVSFKFHFKNSGDNLGLPPPLIYF